MSERTYVECCNGYAYHELVEMKDGAKVCCLVVKPEKEGKFPVVFMQSCYLAPTEEYTPEYYTTCMMFGPALVKAGYVVVMLQTRGTGNSPFESYLPYVHDTEDALQVLDWIRVQDFYNQEIFTDGASYLGYTAMAHMCDKHDDIKAISMQVPVSTRYDAWYQNGFLKLGLMGFWQAMIHRPVGFNSGVLYTSMGGDMSLFKKFPYINWPVTMYGHQEEYWTDLLTHPHDDDWWRKESPGHCIYESLQNIDVPVLLYEGFYDIFYEDSYEFWEKFSDEQKARSAFVISTSGHGWLSYDSAPLAYDPTMPLYSYDYIAEYVVDFFNSVRNGTAPTKAKLGSVMYNPVDSKETFTEKMSLTNGSDKNVLYLNDRKLEREAVNGAVTYEYDPNAPAQFAFSDENGGNIYSPAGNGYLGLGAEAEPNSRQDIISFLGEPISEETYIKGKFLADLTVSSDCEDTCFIVRTYAVKNGVAYNLREDITSLSFQLGQYTPGEKVTLKFETSPIVCKLNPGDYIRVDISSSAAGMYSLHSNVAGKQWEIKEPKTAHNTIYTGQSSVTFFTEKEL